MKKIGILGGTFDPIHIGHLILAEAAYRQFHLDLVYIMPAGNPPHKKNRKGRATDSQRCDMVRAAIAGNPHFRISLLEMNEDGYSYTYRTLETLNAQHPDTRFYFIIGADSLFDFDQWKEPQRLMDACELVVATRNQMDQAVFNALLETRKKQFRGIIHKLDTPNLDISSRHLRNMIANHESVRYYVTDSVYEYIEKNGLYRGETTELEKRQD